MDKRARLYQPAPAVINNIFSSGLIFAAQASTSALFRIRLLAAFILPKIISLLTPSIGSSRAG